MTQGRAGTRLHLHGVSQLHMLFKSGQIEKHFLSSRGSAELNWGSGDATAESSHALQWGSAPILCDSAQTWLGRAGRRDWEVAKS